MNLLGSDFAHNVPLLKVLALPSKAKTSDNLKWISGLFNSKDSDWKLSTYTPNCYECCGGSGAFELLGFLKFYFKK